MFCRTQTNVLKLAACVALVTGAYVAPGFAGSSPAKSDTGSGLAGDQVDVLEKQLIEAKAELEELQAKMANLQKEIELVEKRIKDLETQYQVTADPSLIADIRAAIAHLGELERDLEEMKDAEAELVRRIAKLEARIAALGPSL